MASNLSTGVCAALATVSLVVLSMPGAVAQEPERPLAYAASGESPWPREFQHPSATVVVYQPQPDSFKGNRLEGRVAVSATPKGSDRPIFGCVWLRANVPKNVPS